MSTDYDENPTTVPQPPPVPPVQQPQANGLSGQGWLPTVDHETTSGEVVELTIQAPAVSAALDYASQPDVRAADVHFRSNSRPWLRRGGTFEPEQSLPVVSEAEIRATIAWCGGEEVSSTRHYPAQGPDQNRWRCQTWKAISGPKITFRLLAGKPAVFDELGSGIAPARPAATFGEGLVVIAGATGSGKSTTLCSLIDLLGSQRQCHVITMENPIEVVYPSDALALIEQREIGTHVEDALTGFHSALRSDPDVIVLGELRTEAEAELCLEAAVSGHLVFTTMHAKDTGTVCERLLAGQDASARSKLAQAFQMVVAQRLVPDLRNKHKRHLVAEICPRSDAVVNTIRPGGDLSTLSNVISEQTRGGMDARLAECVQNKTISEADALRAALNRKMLTDKLNESRKNVDPAMSVSASGRNGGRLSRRG